MYWTYFHKFTCIKNEGLRTSFGTTQSKNISTDFITHIDTNKFQRKQRENWKIVVIEHML
jgi:hypothetical protein